MRVGDRVDPDALVGQRWFANPSRGIRAASVEERFALPGGGALAIVRVEIGGPVAARYTVPLEPGPATWAGLAALAETGGRAVGAAGWLLEGLAPMRLDGPPAPAPATAAPRGQHDEPHALGVDQSNTTWVVGDRVVKLYRRLVAGRNPEAELCVALAPDQSAPVPGFRGAIGITQPGNGSRGRRLDVAIVQEFVPGADDEFERSADALAAWLRAGAPPRQAELLAEELVPVGRAVAALHRSLAALRGPGLTPRPAGPADVERWHRAGTRAMADAVAAMQALDPGLAAEIAAARPRLEDALRPLRELRDGSRAGLLTRIHGDLHIGQVIRAADRVLLVDLEGEPSRSAAARRRVDMPLRDVASMLRSIDHVARSAWRRAGGAGSARALEAWIEAARRAFLHGHGARVDEPLLHAMEVEKELYEFTYAARYLPPWRYAPATGLRRLLDRRPA